MQSKKCIKYVIPTQSTIIYGSFQDVFLEFTLKCLHLYGKQNLGLF